MDSIVPEGTDGKVVAERIADWLAEAAQEEWFWSQSPAEHEQEYFAWASDRVRERWAR